MSIQTLEVTLPFAGITQLDATIITGTPGITQITSTTAPTDTSVIWIDPETGIQSIYSGGGWVTQLTATIVDDVPVFASSPGASSEQLLSILADTSPDFADVTADKLILSDQSSAALETGELARSGSALVLGDGVRVGGRHVVPRSTKGSWSGAASNSPVDLGNLAFTAQEMADGAIIRIRGSFGMVATSTLPATAFFGVVSAHTEALALGPGALSGVVLTGASAMQGVMDFQFDLNNTPPVSGAGYLGIAVTTEPGLGGTVVKTVSGTVSQAVLAPYAGSGAEEAIAATSQTFKLQLHTATASGAMYNIVWDLEYDVTLP